MLVIQNRKIKKGIEIPEIIPVVTENRIVTIPAIDKEKYSDFLSLGNWNLYSQGKDEEGGDTLEKMNEYIGDEIIQEYLYSCAFALIGLNNQ